MEPVNLGAFVSRLIVIKPHEIIPATGGDSDDGDDSVFAPETMIADIHVLDGTPTTPGPLVFRGEHIIDPTIIDQCRPIVTIPLPNLPQAGVMVESGDGYRVLPVTGDDTARLRKYITDNRATIHGIPESQ